MENNNRYDYDDLNKPIDDTASQKNNSEPAVPSKPEIDTNYISYRGYHELSSDNEEETLLENKDQVNNGAFPEQKSRFSDDETVQHTTASKKRKSRWLTPIITAILGGTVALGAGSYFGFVDLTGVLPADNGSVKSAIATNDKVNDEEGLKIIDTTKTTSELIKMIDEVSPAVVGVVNIQNSTNYYDYRQPASNETNNSEETGTGSGVIFKKSGNDGFIVTNNHVIENADAIEVSLSDGTRIPAELVGTDPLTDLAVLRIDGSNVKKVAEFGDSEKLSVGEQVIAIGNPLGLDFSGSVTQGIISGLQRTVTVSTSAGEWDMDAIQTDAAINPGNSGGALVNSEGQVIGINSMKISSEEVEGIGFAIPSKEVSTIVNDLLADGKVQRPYVGVSLQSISEIPQYVLQQQLNLPTDVTNGVVVTQVETGSPAGKAGIEAKDVIVSINDTEVTTLGDFRKYLYSNANKGDKVKIKLYRNGSVKTVSVTVTEQ